jgi:acyl dehydratase
VTSLLPTRTVEGLSVGEELPELAIPLTRTLIVATAIASRDYQDVHHDPALAVERGSKDIFMNILTSNAMVERYAKEWAGPAAILRKVKIRLGAPNHPGDTMTMRGSVASVEGTRVELAVTGTNSLGPHVSGTVVLELPEMAEARA